MRISIISYEPEVKLVIESMSDLKFSEIKAHFFNKYPEEQWKKHEILVNNETMDDNAFVSDMNISPVDVVEIVPSKFKTKSNMHYRDPVFDKTRFRDRLINLKINSVENEISIVQTTIKTTFDQILRDYLKFDPRQMQYEPEIVYMGESMGYNQCPLDHNIQDGDTLDMIPTIISITPQQYKYNFIV